jgi:hypothetical protein
MVGYVDDGAYSYAHDNPTFLSQVLTNKYNKLEDWMNANKLVINPDKTHLMMMGIKKDAAKRKRVYMMAGVFTIKPTESEKLLGCHCQLHQSLDWKFHVQDHKGSLLNQLNSRLNGLKVKYRANSNFTQTLITPRILETQILQLSEIFL